MPAILLGGCVLAWANRVHTRHCWCTKGFGRVHSSVWPIFKRVYVEWKVGGRDEAWHIPNLLRQNNDLVDEDWLAVASEEKPERDGVAGGTHPRKQFWRWRICGLEYLVEAGNTELERGNPSGWVEGRIVPKFCKRKVAHPKEGLINDKTAEVCFKGAVEDFWLSIGLGVDKHCWRPGWWHLIEKAPNRRIDE